MNGFEGKGLESVPKEFTIVSDMDVFTSVIQDRVNVLWEQENREEGEFNSKNKLFILLKASVVNLFELLNSWNSQGENDIYI